jgi:hypothetical protein
LVDITAVEVLWADLMGAGVEFVVVEGDLMEVEVREVTAKPRSLFPINCPGHQWGLFGFRRFARVSVETRRRDER